MGCLAGMEKECLSKKTPGLIVLFDQRMELERVKAAMLCCLPVERKVKINEKWFASYYMS